MKLVPLTLPGAYLVEIEPREDERGFFARMFCRAEFQRAGISFSIEQASASFNHRAGTVRGMHYSLPPARESKLIRCTSGRIHDVLVDLRTDSPAYCRSEAVELSATNRRALFAPPGVAHGFQTLVDDSEVQYMMDEPYRAELAAGVRHDDPAFGIRWPLPISVIAQRDREWPLVDHVAAASASPVIW